jgi:hypothetical protein
MAKIKLEAFKWPEIAKQRDYINAFYTYLRKEFSTENLEFLVAEAKAKNEQDYQIIHTNYIIADSPKQINIGSGTFNNLNAAVVIQDWATYKDRLKNAVRDVVALVEKDSWPRFMRTEAYGEIWMDKDDTDDKILKNLKKVLSAKNIPILDAEGKKGPGSEWSKLKKDLVPVRKALETEDISEFMETWEEVKDAATDYITRHKKKFADTSSGKTRRKTLEAIGKYHEMLESVFTNINF